MNSSQTNPNLLAACVQKLEASNRRWKLVNALFLLCGSSLALMGAKPADRIEPPVVRASAVEAREFILKDESGHVYARLTLKPSVSGTKQPNDRMYLMPGQGTAGQATLQFYDDKGDVLWAAPTTPTMVPAK
jgi:hypothetical protein